MSVKTYLNLENKKIQSYVGVRQKQEKKKGIEHKRVKLNKNLVKKEINIEFYFFKGGFNYFVLK